MRVCRITIDNFRGVSTGRVDLSGNALLVGGNSVGKSTVCEALDLVLGPERMFRRPVIDEYDFFGAQYQPVEGVAPEVRVEVVLTDLSLAAQMRFSNHLRKWSVSDRDFADQDKDAIDGADEHPWCLPIVFRGRFDPQEDDFEGNTFFDHPAPVVDDLSPESTHLGEGRRTFGRDDKRYCGYLYLRTNRTGARALSFQRGSLLDTIVRLEDQAEGELWEGARASLGDLDLRDKSKFDTVLSEVYDRASRFMPLASDGIDVHPSDLTRESIRETLRLFVTASPGQHSVPFNRLSTGSLNLFVFALLTYIAELKGGDSVIFAMEEPEIALPPHAQRRLVDFVTRRMGQAIVTSHSPYVIERFEPDDLVMLSRNNEGILSSDKIDLGGLMKPKKFREERRQFADALLGRAVLVVEGGTEATVIPAVADFMDADPSLPYTHLDLAGVSIYDAKSDAAVPALGPVFKALGKRCYGVHDTPNGEFPADAPTHAHSYEVYLQIPFKSIEKLLIAEMPISPKRAFLATVALQPDYPTECGYLADDADDAAVEKLTETVLLARKGAYYGYAALLVAEASSVTELPKSYVDLLLAIEADLLAGELVEASSSSADAGEDSPEESGPPTRATATEQSSPDDQPAAAQSGDSGPARP